MDTVRLVSKTHRRLLALIADTPTIHEFETCVGASAASSVPAFHERTTPSDPAEKSESVDGT
jgi:hypothetical protein